MNTASRAADAKGVVVLISLAFALTALLALVEQATAGRVAQNRERAAWLEVGEILQSPELLALAKKRDWTNNHIALCDGRWLARIQQLGYGGEFELLALLNTQGQVLRLRVTRHLETPGIGDFIATAEHPWMRALTEAQAPDAVSGATITSDAVVAALTKVAQQEPPEGCTG